LEILSMPNIWG